MDFFISEIEFSDGSTFSLSKEDIVVFVGPNNSGKSRALQNIHSKMESTASHGQVIKRINIHSTASEHELIEHIKIHSKQGLSNAGVTYQWLGLGSSFSVRDINSFWQQFKDGNGASIIAGFFTKLFQTSDRLNLAQRAGHIDYGDEPATHPLHYIFNSEKASQALSENFKKAFGLDLFAIQKNAKNVILRVGEKPSLETGETEISDSYIAKLKLIPPIDEQGDGMRAFAGLSIHSIVPHYSIISVDEPEAFLHPPQARFLGRALAGTIGKSKQLFLSSHSGDILRGLLDSDQSNIHIIRIQRDGNVNRASSLPKEKVKEIWKAPLLRYSNVLDGIFHEKVIICEGDADCKFYSAVIDWIYESIDSDVKKPDFMFINANGIGGIDKIMRSLLALSVPVSVIIDFDALNKSELKTLALNLGIDWKNIEKKIQNVKNAINSIHPSPPKTEDSKKEINKFLADENGEFLSPKSIEKMRSLLKTKSGWSLAKEQGNRILQLLTNNKEAIMSDEQVIRRVLEENGLFLVDCGELESFLPLGDDFHGPKWSIEVFENEKLKLQAFTSAKSFVEKLLPVFKNKLVSR